MHNTRLYVVFNSITLRLKQFWDNLSLNKDTKNVSLFNIILTIV